MSIRDDDSDLEWAGALGRRGVLPDPRPPDPTGVPADAHRDPPLPPPGPRPAGHRRRCCGRCPGRPHAARVPRRRRVQRLLRAPLHGADGRGGLVVRPGGLAGLPGALPLQLPRAPRHAQRLRLPDLAHRHRRLAHLRRSASAPRLQEVRLGTKVTSVLETADGVEVTDGNGETASYDAVVVATHPGAGAGDAGRADRRRSARCSARCPTRPNTALLHTDTSVLPRGRRRLGVVELPARPRPEHPDGARRGTVTYDLTRLQRARHRHPLPGDAGRRAPRRPEHRDRPDGVRAPALHPRLGRRPGAAAEIDTDRVAFAGAYHGWGFHEDGARSGLRGRRAPRARPGRSGRRRADVPAGGRLRHHDPPHPAHARSRARFTHRSHTWLVDLDELPDHGLLVAAGSLRGPRPPRRPATAASARTSAPSSAGTASLDRDGRVLMAAHAARPRLLLQPDQRVLVLRRPTARRGRRGRGAQHLRRPARLPRPPRRAGPRARREGDVRLAVPRHRRQLRPRRARARRPAATSPSPCPPTTGATASAPPSPAHRSDDRSRCAPPPPPCAARCSSAPTASGCGCAACRSDPRPSSTTRKGSHDDPSTPPVPRHRLAPRTGPDSTGPGRTARPRRPPRSPAQLFRRRGRPPRRRPSPRTRDGTRTSARRPRDDRAPARRVLRPPRPRRADRLRRGLPDRRLGRPRTSAAS